MSYSDELSVKLTAKDEMSRALKEARKQLDETHRAMVQARKDYQDTGSPEALRQLRDLEKQAEQTRKAIKDSGDAAKRARKDYQDFVDGTGKYASRMDRFRTSVERNATAIRNTGLVMAGAMALFSKSALQQFSRVEDASSALSATFSDQGDAMIAWARKSGDALNLSQADALDALMTFSGYAKTAGLQGQELASFSEQLVARSADLASYYGGTTADAISAIGAALRGEAEPARRYQIFVDDAALKAEYFAQTGEKVNGTLTAQQKVLAASALVMKQSSVAQGDLARTADSTANTLKDASQQWADFQSAMGETVAQGVTPFIKGGNTILGIVTKLPQPVQAIGMGITALGAAAMIATPRIIALNTALASRGGILGVAKSAKGAAIGVAALTAAMAALQAQADEDGNVFTTENAYGVDEYGRALRDIVQPGWGQSVANALAAVTDAVVPHNTALDDAKTRMGEFDKQLSDLVTSGNSAAAARKFDELVAGAAEWGATAEEVKALLPGYTAAMGQVASTTERTATAHRTAATAADLQAAAEGRLTGALGKAERLLARRDAMRAYRKATADFIAKPSAEAGDAVSRSMLGVANTYKDPEKRAKFVKRSYKDIEAAVKGSNLPSNIKTKITKPLTDAYIEARKLLSTMQAIAVQEANPYTRNPGAQAALGYATGGIVHGPGTGTSDSIPALLSNGEYVIRAAAVKAIGYDQLDRLNRADRAPVLPPIVNAPTITVPVQAPGRDAPLVGSMVVHASQQVDVDLALMRLHRQQQRDQRTRTAGTR